MRTLTILSCFLLALAFTRPVAGQRTETVVLEETCTRCVIVTTASVELTGPAKGGVQTWPNQVRSAGDGWVVNFHQLAQIHWFQADGTFSHEVGRQGPGPGEWRDPRSLAVSDSGVVVFDWRNRSAVYLNNEGRVRGQFPQPFRDIASAVPHPENGWVISAIVRTPDGAGYPLHLFDPETGRSRPMGNDGVYRSDHPRLMHRHLAASDSYLWSGHVRQYAIDKLAWDGSAIRTLVRHSDWFPAELRSLEITPETGPVPLLIDLTRDDDGLIWVALLLADRRVREGLGNRTTVEGRAFYPIEDYTKIWNTRVEVIDPDQGVVLASRTFDEMTTGFAAPGVIGLVRQEPAGHVRLFLHSLGLHVPL